MGNSVFIRTSASKQLCSDGCRELGVAVLNDSNQEVPRGNNHVPKAKHLTQVSCNSIKPRPAVDGVSLNASSTADCEPRAETRARRQRGGGTIPATSQNIRKGSHSACVMETCSPDTDILNMFTKIHVTRCGHLSLGSLNPKVKKCFRN